MNTIHDTQIPRDHVIHGNCLDVLPTLPDQSVDLIFADPPYNLQLRNTLRRPNQTLVEGVHEAWDTFPDVTAYDTFTRTWLHECRRILKDSGTIWVIGTYHNIFRVGTVMMDLGFWILNDVIWYKVNPMPNFHGTRFQNATETLIWAAKAAGQKYTFNYHAMKYLNDEQQMQNVWHIPICTGSERITMNGRKAHPTQKPEALLYRVILASSRPGDIVLDPFFGTGTTGAVAKRLRRHFLGIEQDPTYVAIARDRLATITPVEGDDRILTTPSKRDAPRVAFGDLITAGYITVGQHLLSRDRSVIATVKADGHVMWNGMSGSIHAIAARAQNKPTCNGWEYWCVDVSDGSLIGIDELRERYRTEHMR